MSTQQKHAYLIMAHADMEQLRKLIYLLDDPRNDIFLHVDKKCTSFHPDSFHTEYAGLHIVERMRVYWGHLSLIKLEYHLFEAARKQGSYSYYHLLSGADLPIKSQDSIHNFCSQHQGKDFIAFWLFDSAYADAYYKVSRYHFGMRYEQTFRQRILSILSAKIRFIMGDIATAILGKRTMDCTFVKGSQWLSITEETLDFILQAKSKVLKRYRYTRCPDEIFVQTLVYNDPYFRSKVYDMEGEHGDLRLLIWPPATPSPQILRKENLPMLLESSAFFARKFSTAVDPEVSDELIRRLKG